MKSVARLPGHLSRPAEAAAFHRLARYLPL